MAERETGTVKWFSEEKGCGVIARDRGGDVFVHYSDLQGMTRRFLLAGQRVAFTVAHTPNGPQARAVAVLPERNHGPPGEQAEVP